VALFQQVPDADVRRPEGENVRAVRSFLSGSKGLGPDFRAPNPDVSAFPKAMSNGSINGSGVSSDGTREQPVQLRNFRSYGPSSWNIPGLTIVVLLIGVAWGVLALPAHAQIESYVDGHGRLVYTNEDSTPRRLDAASSTAHAAEASPSRPAPPARLEHIVDEAAQRHDLDPALVNAVISTESGWNPQAISNKGAMGLMQLIPGTAERFGVGNPFDPAQNIDGGTAYLKALLDRYNGDLTKSLAAYNAGERAVDRSGGVPPFWQTRQYVRKVKDAYFRPGSGRNPSSVWTPPRDPIRRETDSKGQVLFTNE
jgi:Transglycosylase SLT domain